MAEDQFTIGANFHLHAEKSPDKAALICDQEKLVWRDLTQHVGYLTRWFSQNTPANARIGLLLPNCLLLPVIFFAIARSGRAALILDIGLPMRSVQQALKEAQCTLTISFENLTGVQNSHLQLSEDFTLSDNLKEFGKVDLTEIKKKHPDKIFYLGITSGSTGLPKIYQRSHHSWIRSFDIEAVEFDHNSDDIILAPGALSHSLFLYAIVHAMHIGATAIFSKKFRPDRVLLYVAEYNPTIFYTVPSQILLLLDWANSRIEIPEHKLRWLISSGSKWNEFEIGRLKTIFPIVQFAEFYGASETSFVSVAKDGEDVPTGSVGRAFQDVEIIIRDNDHRVKPAREIGQIWVRSPMLFSGYTNDSDKDNCVDQQGYISVGDIGYLDLDNYLHLVGRADRMIVTAGKNLYPEEIELVFAEHENIAEIAIIPIQDDKRGIQPVALVKFAAGRTTGRPELIKYARENLPLYKIPRSYFLVPNWPRLHSGKTDFQSLQNSHSSGLFKAIE